MKNALSQKQPDQYREGTCQKDVVLKRLSLRVEQILGIQAATDALEKLREALERRCGSGCFESPGFFDRILSTPDEIFSAARLLTVNETYFFREESSFELLRRELLPRLIRLNRPIRACSAATSIGCEAYSLAMVMDYYSRTMQPFSFGIDAFDVNPEAVETAKKGRYTGNSLREDGACWKFLLDRYTCPEGEGFVIKSFLQKQVHFYTHNILDGLMGNRYDLIFFRNSLIYFSADKRKLLLDRLTEALYPGGFLILGVSETLSVSHPLLDSQCMLDFFYFQKVLKAVPRPAGAPRITAAEGEAKKPAPDAVSREEPVQDHPAPADVKKGVIPSPNPEGIAALIDGQGGAIAEKLSELLREAGKGGRAAEELFAGVIYLLGQEKFSGADKLLSFIENHSDLCSDSVVFTRFLRGEYHYFNKRKGEAEASYREAAGRNNAFWPAFYRLSALAVEGHPVQYEYKIRKALESLERGYEKRYEVFIGGFSPDYYRRTLEKRLCPPSPEAPGGGSFTR
jgi:chemotaxis protein methyltransferase CheR